MSFHWLDIVVLSLIVILGAQGILRGAVREFFSLLGVGLGIFLGSRLALVVGRWTSDHSFNFSSESATKLAGFAIVFLVVWAICFLVGLWLSKRLRRKESMARRIAVWLDRIFGFFIGVGKVYVLFAAIIFSLSQTAAISKWAQNNLEDSLLYPSLKATGGFLIKLDAQTREALKEAQSKAEDIKQTVEESVKAIEPPDVAEIIERGAEVLEEATKTTEQSEETAKLQNEETSNERKD
ncbi:MAG: CvpA family protein [Helicobacteraceae bacterium]|jgi:uncharacterized membrane protein required for colicin V production|nr:CvpA family protein [Helicobacteraceae bacterium]